MRFNFDTTFYKNKYRYLFENDEDELKIWRHFINKGINKGYLYFNKQDSINSPIKKTNSLMNRIEYFKNKNTNIFFMTDGILRNNNDIFNQNIMKNIVNTIINNYSDINIYFIKYDFLIKQIVHLNQNEYQILQDKGFLLPYNKNNLNYDKCNKYFNDNKNNLNNILFYSESISVFDVKKITQFATQYSKIKICGFINENNIESYLSKESNILDNYYKIISKFNVIYSSSQYFIDQIKSQLTNRRLSIPNSIIPLEIPIEKPNLFINNSKNYILSFVSFNSQYNIIELINVFNEYLIDYPSHQLYLYDLNFQTEILYKRKVELILNKNITIYNNKNEIFTNKLYTECLFYVSCLNTNFYDWDIKKSILYSKHCICQSTSLNVELNEKYKDYIEIVKDNNELLNKMKEINNKDLFNYQTKDIVNQSWNSYCNNVIGDLKTKNILSENYNYNNKHNLYFYVEKTLTNHRSGIENYSINIIKNIEKILKSYKNINMYLVKWDDNNKKLVPCNYKETFHVFNYNENELTESFKISDKEIEFDNSLLICTEIPNFNFTMHLSNYIVNNNLKSVFVLHDIIALQFNNEEYKYLKEDFKSYLYNNICTAYKVISVSDFTRNEFLNYLNKYPYQFGIPTITYLPMSYQFHNKDRNYKDDHSENKDCTRFLLPGTIESRKQQILFMKLFNNILRKEPNFNIELIIFGKVVNCLKEEFDKELLRSNGKIDYRGEVSNDELLNLYKEVDITCVVSKYEGFGLPISESLWNGTPVLTSNYGAMQETGSVGGCMFVDTKNEQKIIDAIKEISNNKDILDNLRNEIKNSKLLDWSTYSNNFLKECLNLC